MARRKKKNDITDIAIPVSVLIALLIVFYPDTLESIIKALLLITLFGVILFLIFKDTFKKKSPTLRYDPLRTKLKQSSRNITPQLVDPIDSHQNKNNDNLSYLDHYKINSSVKKSKPEQWSLELLQKIDWKYFEEVCCSYFESLGYSAKLSPIGADEGIDIYLYKDNYPNKIFGIIQCKRWTKQVGVEQVRSFFGVQIDKEVPLAVFISSSGFSNAAKSFCDNKHLKLMSGTDLLYQLQKLPPEIQSKLLKKATRGDYTTPTCANCDVKMILRTSKKSGRQFWGCKNYPRCKTTLHIKK